MLNEGAKELGPVLGSVGSDQLSLDEAISEILKYSLLRRDPNARILEIHRLVQAALRDGMEAATQRLWAERAVRAVNRAFPDVEFSSWAGCSRLLPQVHTCAELINQWSFEFPEAARLLDGAGVYLYERGRYAEVESLYQRALSIWEKDVGLEHAKVAISLNKLAELYRAQGRYAKAELPYKRALEIREKALGPEHPEVATNLNDLALLYHAQGQYERAEPLYKRALAIQEKVLGPEHAKVATCLKNYALLLLKMDRTKEAEPLEVRATAIRTKSA